jgi:hypothetical protein
MTDRTNDIATLITQLRVLGQLTRTEAQVARLRVAQASTDAVRDELRQNATDADGRAARIAGALRELGALPDPVTPLIGRVAVLVRGALEQAQPLDEAVLGDLALEHQLRDRAQYVAALADAAGRPDVRQLADHLVAAHTETVEWLTDLLADLAAGRPAALGASPLQQVVAQVTHVANTPTRSALDSVGAGLGQAVQTATQTASKAAGAARDTATKTLDTATAAAGEAATGVAHAAAATAGAVRKAAGDTLGTVTGATGKAVTGTVRGATAAADLARDTTAHALHGAADTAEEAAATGDAVADTTTAAGEAAGSDTDAEPPIPGFAELPAHAAVAALRALDDPSQVQAMLESEQAHANRPAVVEAARLRAAALHAE